MSYPVIILGAGASHDYVPEELRVRSKEYQPPLTDQLCNPWAYENNKTKFRDVEPLISGAGANIKRKGLEEYLKEVAVIAERNRERAKQLIALRFYLHSLFQSISEGFGKQPANNYAELINQINDYGGNACLVTTNYDFLLEQCLEGRVNERISSYVSGPIKLIKLHGSCDWMYTMDILGGPPIKSSYEYMMEYSFGIGINLYPRRETSYSTQVNGEIVHLLPAIAIPLPGKNEFICPEPHLRELKAALSMADRILIIGWRANDTHLISLIEQHVKQSVLVTIVAGGLEFAKEVKSKLDHITNLSFNFSDLKFTQFVQSGNHEEFFRRKEL